MEALRIIARAQKQQLIIDLPSTLQGDRFEVIVLPVFDTAAPPVGMAIRRPPPELAGTMIHDDLLQPAMPDEEK